MYKTSKYTPTDKMSYLICDNYTLLQVMSRFDLSLGFGDKTVQEVCRENGVDCRTFLAVVNFMIEDSDRMEDNVKDISMPSAVKASLTFTRMSEVTAVLSLYSRTQKRRTRSRELAPKFMKNAVGSG